MTTICVCEEDKIDLESQSEPMLDTRRFSMYVVICICKRSWKETSASVPCSANYDSTTVDRSTHYTIHEGDVNGIVRPIQVRVNLFELTEAFYAIPHPLKREG
jgi:hypothetical protein